MRPLINESQFIQFDSYLYKPADIQQNQYTYQSIFSSNKKTAESAPYLMKGLHFQPFLLSASYSKI